MLPLAILALLGFYFVTRSNDASSASPPALGTGTTTAPPRDPADKTCQDWLDALPDDLVKDVAASKTIVELGSAADRVEKRGFPEAALCVRAIAKLSVPPESACEAALLDVPDEPAGGGSRTLVRNMLADPSVPVAELNAVANALKERGLDDAAACVMREAAARPLPTLPAPAPHVAAPAPSPVPSASMLAGVAATKAAPAPLEPI